MPLTMKMSHHTFVLSDDCLKAMATTLSRTVVKERGFGLCVPSSHTKLSGGEYSGEISAGKEHIGGRWAIPGINCEPSMVIVGDYHTHTGSATPSFGDAYTIIWSSWHHGLPYLGCRAGKRDGQVVQCQTAKKILTTVEMESLKERLMKKKDWTIGDPDVYGLLTDAFSFVVPAIVNPNEHIEKPEGAEGGKSEIKQEGNPRGMISPIIHEAITQNPDPAEFMPVEVTSAFPEGDKSVFNPSEKAEIDKFINDVPDKNDTGAINYWIKWGERDVYLEGWCDKCLAGTGFPTIEGGEWDAKIEYMVRNARRTLIAKQAEGALSPTYIVAKLPLTLIEGGFREFEAGEMEHLYGVTWGVYIKSSKAKANPKEMISPAIKAREGNPRMVVGKLWRRKGVGLYEEVLLEYKGEMLPFLHATDKAYFGSRKCPVAIDKMRYIRESGTAPWYTGQVKLPSQLDLLCEKLKNPPDNGTDIMFFNVPKARDQLIRESFVYTLRPRMRRTGQDIAVYGSYFKRETIGDVRVDFIKEVKGKADLAEYLSGSGFRTVDDWWEAAKGSTFLFKVTRKEQEGNPGREVGKMEYRGNPGGTEVYVEKLPKCDFCSKLATYDAKTTMGPWAHMCEEHYLRHGIGLGTGKGQKLIPRKALGEAEKIRGEPEKELAVRMTEADLEAATFEDMWYPVCPYCGASTPAEPDAHAIYCQACNRRFKIFNPFFSHSPISPHCERVLEDPPKCFDFRGIRSFVMCRAWDIMEKGKRTRLPVGEAWQEARRACARE